MASAGLPGRQCGDLRALRQFLYECVRPPPRFAVSLEAFHPAIARYAAMQGDK